MPANDGTSKEGVRRWDHRAVHGVVQISKRSSVLGVRRVLEHGTDNLITDVVVRNCGRDEHLPICYGRMSR